MKKFLYSILSAIVFLLGYNFCFATMHTITSLPTTLSYNGSNYSDTAVLDGTKLSSATSGLLVTGDNIVILLGTDTLEFGTGCGDNLYGISLPYQAHDIKIEGGTILHNPSCTADSAWSCVDIKLSSGDFIYIHNTDMIVEGWDGHCIDGAESQKMIEIEGGHWTSNVRGYTDRCSYDGAALRAGDGQSLSAGEYTFKIHGVNITRSPHAGLKLAAGKHLVYDDTINCDGRNELYDTYTNFCYTSVNPYAIAMRKNWAGSQCYNNMITSGTDYEGGEGILLECNIGTEEDPIEIYGNTINVHNGRNLYTWASGGQTMGLFMRGKGNCWIHFHHNNITVTLDTLTSTTSIGKVSEGLRTDWYDESYDCSNGGMPHDNIIENNRVNIVLNSEGTESYARTIAQKDSTAIYNNFDRYNYYKGGNIIVVMNTTNAPCNNMTLDQDTLAFVGSESGRKTWQIGRYNKNCINNYALDCIYQDGAKDTNIVWYSSSGESELALQRTVVITVKNTTGQLVVGAQVDLKNNYNDTILTGTTNGTGTLSGIVNYWYEAEDGADSIFFNPFICYAVKSGEADTVSYTISDTTAAITCTLNVSGEGDGTPPENVGGVDTNSVDKYSVNLFCDKNGSADCGGYTVRYNAGAVAPATYNMGTLGDSTSSINDTTFSVSSLFANTQYSFSIFAFDTVGNYSSTDAGSKITATTDVEYSSVKKKIMIRK